MKKVLNHLENIAYQYNKDKIVILLHKNLHLYNKYYKENGFIISTKYPNDPFSLEAIKFI